MTTVDEIRNVILLLRSPPQVGSPSQDRPINITHQSHEITVSNRFRGNITILSSRVPNTINGLLYVPDLPAGDPCHAEAAPFVPDPVVRRSNLPPTDYYKLVAIAPWTSPGCSKKYMAAADSAPIRAFIFYRPNNSSAAPPHATSLAWDINGSTKWRMQTYYPVFAVSGQTGQSMMLHLNSYSGNATEIPFAQNISDLYGADVDDFIRIWTDMDVSTTHHSGPVWLYFLIVAVVLAIIISATSLTMHLTQAWRRIQLRRRVISGEVNLEAMGIKRLTVSMDEVRKFPLYTYRYDPPANSPPTSPSIPLPCPVNIAGCGQAALRGVGNGPQQVEPMCFGKPLPNPISAPDVACDSQPMCLICMEQFQNRVTVIREISCGHIFHPECIDEFLTEVSSLCPICKASMLPAGYCPKITNETVRRERAIRRLRHISQDDEESGDDSQKGGRRGIGTIIADCICNRRDFSPGPIVPPRPPKAKKKRRSHQRSRYRGVVDLSALTGRERMRALAGSPLEDRTATPPRRWRQMRTKIFPGY